MLVWRLDAEQFVLAGVVDLERRVLDLKAVVQQPLKLAAALVAVVVVADEHMRRQRREAARDLPNVEVMHLIYRRIADERAPNLIGAQLDPPRNLSLSD